MSMQDAVAAALVALTVSYVPLSILFDFAGLTSPRKDRS